MAVTHTHIHIFDFIDDYGDKIGNDTINIEKFYTRWSAKCHLSVYIGNWHARQTVTSQGFELKPPDRDAHMTDKSWCLGRNSDTVRWNITGFFKTIVGVLTTCHTQYTWDRSICIFLIEQHSKFLLHTLQALYMCTLCDSTNINTIIEFVPNCL